MKLVATQHLSVNNDRFTQEKLQKDTYGFNGVEVLFVTTW
jgi:sensor domain CHASE-containing protein